MENRLNYSIRVFKRMLYMSLYCRDTYTEHCSPLPSPFRPPIPPPRQRAFMHTGRKLEFTAENHESSRHTYTISLFAMLVIMVYNHRSNCTMVDSTHHWCTGGMFDHCTRTGNNNSHLLLSERLYNLIKKA